MHITLIRYCLYFLASIAFLPSVMAQNGYKLEYGIGTGVSNYLGEIGGKDKGARPFIVDLKLVKTNFNQTIYLRYKFHPVLSAKLSANFLRIGGEDRLSTNIGRRYRNLSFRNDIYDIEGTINWLFYSSVKPVGIYRKARTYLTAYMFTGVGVFHHNPKTLYQGSFIPLQPIQTEGVKYSKWGYCIPLGIGMYVSINKTRKRTHRIGIEINWRYTNTDYLDDISTVYKNPSELSSSTAIALSNRNTELTNQPAGVSGNFGWIDDGKGNNINKAPRGNPNNKDSYISLNVTYGIALKSKYTRSKGKKIRTVKF